MFFYFYGIILVGDYMKFAIDKNSLNIAKKDSNDYIYLFDDELLDELIETGLHCVYYKKCEYVDINLTDYDVDCMKKAKITDKDYDVLSRLKDVYYV